MSASYNILPIKEVQTNIELKKQLQTLTAYESNNPTRIYRHRFMERGTRAEIFESIIEIELKVINENKQFDKFELDNGIEFIIHSLEINDTELSFGSDLTMRCPNDSSKNYRLESLIGLPIPSYTFPKKSYDGPEDISMDILNWLKAVYEQAG